MFSLIFQFNLFAAWFFHEYTYLWRVRELLQFSQMEKRKRLMFQVKKAVLFSFMFLFCRTRHPLLKQWFMTGKKAIGAVHKGRHHFFPIFWPLPPPCPHLSPLKGTSPFHKFHPHPDENHQGQFVPLNFFYTPPPLCPQASSIRHPLPPIKWWRSLWKAP